MAGLDRERLYRRYISYLNDRRIEELGEFVHEKLSYNGQPMTLLDDQNLIAGGISAIPALFFDIHLLVIDGDRLASRLNFDCTPQGEFLGLQPTGKPVSFSEHVFYIKTGSSTSLHSRLYQCVAQASWISPR
jgi:predicted ester cyclase